MGSRRRTVGLAVVFVGLLLLSCQLIEGAASSRSASATPATLTTPAAASATPWSVTSTPLVLTPGPAAGPTPTIAAFAFPDDADQDARPDAGDNCPAAANADQADTDQNGVGDLCDLPFGHGGWAGVTDAGQAVQVSADERWRPAVLIGPEVRAAWAWSDDARRVVLNVEAGGERGLLDQAADLSDAGLVAAVSRVAAETGSDSGLLLAWIAANPGRVLRIARGEELPPGEPAASHSNLPAGVGLINFDPTQTPEELTDEYLTSLAITQAMNDYVVALLLAALRDRVTEIPADMIPPLASLWDIFSDAGTTIRIALYQQTNRCVPCSINCAIKCGAGLGACFLEFPEPSPCFENIERECNLEHGVFYLGQTCPGACWLTAPGTDSKCTATDENTCLAIPDRGGDVTSLWCEGATCEEPICAP
ncbi:MAG: thrombospondin type 3 repeat-containing protein [Anaerolineales bacterium]|nr:thrombospondin type 3 repeat-containing protein [Anaerolineales bacterium]